MLTGPSQQCRGKENREIVENKARNNKYTMSNDNLAIYTGYECLVDVQGYGEIEVDMYI
jgi:hypothetical protein